MPARSGRWGISADDFNGIGGTDSDLGDPVYAIGDGEVVYAGTPSAGWGTVVIVGHRVPNAGVDEGGGEGTPPRYRVIQSFYAHLDDVRVYVGKVVRRGEPIASIGPTAKGSNWPHLHFELRESRVIAPGVGYADSAMDRINPEEFFAKYRGAPKDLLNPPPEKEVQLPVLRSGEVEGGEGGTDEAAPPEN